MRISTQDNEEPRWAERAPADICAIFKRMLAAVGGLSLQKGETGMKIKPPCGRYEVEGSLADTRAKAKSGLG